MLHGVGNILPFAPADSGNASSLSTVGPTSTTTSMGGSSGTTASPSDDGNSTDVLPWPTCCQNLTTGLCKWIEPPGWMCVDEDDRKKTVWTEDDCLLVFPDDINSFTDRFNAYNEDLKRKANAVVRIRWYGGTVVRISSSTYSTVLELKNLECIIGVYYACGIVGIRTLVTFRPIHESAS